MGGGQPIRTSKERASIDIRGKRASALYTIDEKSTIRKSHENPVLQKIYEEYLGEAGGHKAHELLHTSYVKRNKYMYLSLAFIYKKLFYDISIHVHQILCSYSFIIIISSSFPISFLTNISILNSYYL